MSTTPGNHNANNSSTAVANTSQIRAEMMNGNPDYHYFSHANRNNGMGNNNEFNREQRQMNPYVQQQEGFRSNFHR